MIRVFLLGGAGLRHVGYAAPPPLSWPTCPEIRVKRLADTSASTLPTELVFAASPDIVYPLALKMQARGKDDEPILAIGPQIAVFLQRNHQEIDREMIVLLVSGTTNKCPHPKDLPGWTPLPGNGFFE